ncbi:hypothetical protein [Winogradskyella haliclonae]|uniref:Nuclear transport factor 2 family protein n=1 Tax=Winogradskyella haliclonae TaxID=2048558 RepID=A0ABQ2C063_9FLAO|nr:hypothetical protein [Winogradskyella haliclonae]GGI57586.1 hypothetical protein GCM10011444_18950 [Winogradskyella haliclonae]
MKIKCTLFIALVLTTFCFSQNQEEDRKHIDEIIMKLYKSISFTKTKSPDYKTLKAIHYHEAIVGAVDTTQIKMFKEADFTNKNKENFKKYNVKSFVEKELSHITHVYGGVAVRFSPYEFTIKAGDKQQTIRGVNTFQLIKDPKKGWLIYSTIFSDTTSYPDIPEAYLKM